MGRLLEYVLLLSSLSIVLAAPQQSSHDRGRQRNLTRLHRLPNPRNDPFHPPRTSPLTTLGLHAYAADDRRPTPPRKTPKLLLPPQNLYRLPPNDSLHHSFSRRHSPPRHPTYRPSPRACDPCNSAPWVPILHPPDSYRQQRTHLHPPLDHLPHPSESHSLLLPPLPLPPPAFDATIPSSFGLPLGNIPTGHGLLAPPYSTPLHYHPPHPLLDTNTFPELSPLPVLPIHDSRQFFHFDSSIPDLVPPPAEPLDISSVVLTISEDSPLPPNHKHTPSDLTPQPTAFKENNSTTDFGRLEILQSVPLAEFTSVVSHQQHLPLYPPLQSDFPHQDDFRPPHHTPGNNTDPSGEASAPKPLTGPSLSWLFSDHTAPPSPAPPSPSPPFPTEPNPIASVLNNELRPVSPHTPPAKPKKIQIIIPYTTKPKDPPHDSNALDSLHHEVFLTPSIPHSTPPPTTPRNTYLPDMHHIIASNIRDLLRQEIDSSQNYPLQNNIDNWTALEYSNHKTVSTKAPKDVVAHALAVTSIPGTSISHLLLPSKKIPNEYLLTTPLPAYDEPRSPPLTPHNATVNSSPFTARPYATTNVYNPAHNHHSNHTHPWGRLKENLVLPEARTRTRAFDLTTALYAAASSERVQIVTPTPQRNHTSFRRTTRHAGTTEAPGKLARRPLLPSRLNSTKLERVSDVTATTVRPANASRTESAGGRTVAAATEGPVGLSVNDVFPFRNRELPWEAGREGSAGGVAVGRERKSLIKQVNVQRPRAAEGSS